MTEWSRVPPELVPAPEPQPVLTPLTANAIFLVLTIDSGGEDTVRDLLSDWTSVARSVGFRAPDAPLAAVAAIGSRAWDRLFAGPRPAELHPFRELRRPRAPPPPPPVTCCSTSGMSGWTSASSSRPTP